MQVLTDQDFAKVSRDTSLLMVMFSAPWAGPCHMVRPAYDEAAGRLGNTVKFVEFVLDDNPDTPEKYGVRQIPLFMLFKDGKPAALTAGAVSADVIMEMCNAALVTG